MNRSVCSRSKSRGSALAIWIVRSLAESGTTWCLRASDSGTRVTVRESAAARLPSGTRKRRATASVTWASVASPAQTTAAQSVVAISPSSASWSGVSTPAATSTGPSQVSFTRLSPRSAWTVLALR
jgi:hypothetical protein